MELPNFNNNGSVVISEDDLNFADIKNEAWLDTALQQFFEETGFKPIDMPYFANRQDYEICRRMKKINSIMIHYCAYSISEVLRNSRTQEQDTGDITYKVKKSVLVIRSHFNDAHIIKALNTHHGDINVPISIKKAFKDCFEKLRKAPVSQPKKPTPDESIKRVIAKAEANGAGNTDTSSTQSDKNIANGRFAEIYHIIDTYNKSLKSKPKKQATGIPKMPPIPKKAPLLSS